MSHRSCHKSLLSLPSVESILWRLDRALEEHRSLAVGRDLGIVWGSKPAGLLPPPRHVDLPQVRAAQADGTALARTRWGR